MEPSDLDRVLAVLHARRASVRPDPTTREIVELSGLGNVRTYGALARLIRSGHVLRDAPIDGRVTYRINDWLTEDGS